MRDPVDEAARLGGELLERLRGRGVIGGTRAVRVLERAGGLFGKACGGGGETLGRRRVGSRLLTGPVGVAAAASEGGSVGRGCQRKTAVIVLSSSCSNGLHVGRDVSCQQLFAEGEFALRDGQVAVGGDSLSSAVGERALFTDSVRRGQGGHGLREDSQLALQRGVHGELARELHAHLGEEGGATEDSVGSVRLCGSADGVSSRGWSRGHWGCGRAGSCPPRGEWWRHRPAAGVRPGRRGSWR